MASLVRAEGPSAAFRPLIPVARAARTADVSFDSAELRGRKRSRGGADSDEEVELEEFERKEIMRVIEGSAGTLLARESMVVKASPCWHAARALCRGPAAVPADLFWGAVLACGVTA